MGDISRPDIPFTMAHCGLAPGMSSVIANNLVSKLKNPKTGKIRSGIPITYNGIDRIDSTKGYFNDNVVSCCKVCNRAKSNLSLEDFKQWAANLYLKTIKNN